MNVCVCVFVCVCVAHAAGGLTAHWHCAACRAYQANDVKAFERILRVHKEAIMGDPFVKSYIQGSDKVQRRRGRGLGSQTERVCASVFVCVCVCVRLCLCVRVFVHYQQTHRTHPRERRREVITLNRFWLFFFCACVALCRFAAKHPNRGDGEADSPVRARAHFIHQRSPQHFRGRGGGPSCCRHSRQVRLWIQQGQCAAQQQVCRPCSVAQRHTRERERHTHEHTYAHTHAHTHVLALVCVINVVPPG